jgi:hypothetical protein
MEMLSDYIIFYYMRGVDRTWLTGRRLKPRSTDNLDQLHGWARFVRLSEQIAYLRDTF